MQKHKQTCVSHFAGEVSRCHADTILDSERCMLIILISSIKRVAQFMSKNFCCFYEL